MPLEARDPAHLWDMLDAAQSIQEFTAGIDREDYLADRLIQRAVERSLEIVGEAARRVSQSLRDEHPEIPWRSIIGLRNILAHEYGEIDQSRLWELVVRDIPPLIAAIEALLPEPPTPPEE